MVTDYSARRALQKIKLLADAGVYDSRLATLASRVSISRALLKLIDGTPIDGVDREYFEARAHIAGKVYDPLQPIIGWDLMALNRADSVYPAGAGGYLVETQVPTAADALRPASVCAALGATFINATGNIAWPRQTGIAQAQWLGSESTVATQTQQTLSHLGLVPHTVSAYTEISRQLLLQANPDAVVLRDLTRAIANAADLAALYGSGLNGQPSGLTLDQGVASFSGASLGISGLVNAFVALGDGLGARGGVAANRTVAGTMRLRAETSSSTKTLWSGRITDGTVLDFPARSTTAIPANSLIVGSWEYLIIATWAGGIELETNAYGDSVTGVNNFRQGITGIRAMLSMAAGAIFPGAFTSCANFS